MSEVVNIREVIEANDENFEKTVMEQSKKVPVVVDFWASWCQPCKMLAPVIEKVIKDYNGRVILAKFNVDENQEKPQEYGVMAVPTVKFFKNGKAVDEFIGFMMEKDIKKWIDKNL